MGTSNILNFNLNPLTNYTTNQVQENAVSILDGGNTLKLQGNGWNKISLPYNITANTILKFEFKSTSQGEIQGIGFDNDNNLSENRTFQLYGTQNWGLTKFDNYAANAGTWKTYEIPVGQFYTGNMKYLFFANDQDVKNPKAESWFKNVQVYEKPVAEKPVAANAIPVAKNDQLTAIQSTPITIASSSLLSNDTDADGNSLTLTGVSNAFNGTVQLNTSGNIVFTPNKNFIGNASFKYSISDGQGGTAQAIATVKVNPNYLKFSNYQMSSYDGQDIKSTISMSQEGKAINLAGNTWKAINYNYKITANTVIEFDFKSAARGEIQGIGFDNDLTLSSNRFFELYGAHTSGIQTYRTYSGTEWQHYKIPVGQFYTGDMKYIVLGNDHDVTNPTAISDFANLHIYEGLPGNDIPVAVDDSGFTVANAPLTFKSSQLLANDSDVDQDALTIKSVTAKTGGKVTLDKQGNVIFTPTANFTGVATFDYTVRDEAGATDTATVSVNVKSANIGTNLTAINYYSPQLPFLDVFKSSGNWLTQTNTTWDTNERGSLVTDADGWVKSLKGTGSTQQFTRVATLINGGLEGRYPGGRYVVLYEGEGTLQYSFDAKKVSSLSTPGRDVIDVTPKNGIMLQITATDPNNTGKYLKNIRVVPEAYESTYSKEIFNPAFIDKIDSYSTLRFMEWMRANNNSSQRNWSDRPTLNTKSWGTEDTGAPVEVMVELSNRLDTNPWFSMPHLATDDYITKFATYVRDHIEPGLKVYVELSNEVWNPLFSQNQWAENLSTTESAVQSYGKRATQVMNIWDNVFGDKKDQVIGVMGAQAANPTTGVQAMAYADDSIDAIAIAPYVGGYLGNSEYEAQVTSWTKDADGGLNKLFDEILQGGVLNGGPAGGALAHSLKSASAWQALSQKYNVPLIAYEAGQHLVGVKAVTNNDAITNLFIQANRDPRMGEVYDKILTQWYQVMGGELLTQFNDLGRPSKWGSWGALEHLDQTSSPKYDAVMNFINDHTVSTAV